MLTDFFYDLGVMDVFIWLAERIGGADLWQQILMLVLAGAVPFIESHVGSFLGVLFGVPAGVAIPAAVIGNLLCTLTLVLASSAVRTAATRDRAAVERVPAAAGRGTAPAGGIPAKTEGESRLRHRVRQNLERYGVPGVCLLGPLVLASQITAPILVAIGARRQAVIAWQVVAIVAWGIAFGLFGEAIMQWFGPDV